MPVAVTAKKSLFNARKVCRFARRYGFSVNPHTLSIWAHQRNNPLTKSLPSRGVEILFPRDIPRLTEIIMAVPKKSTLSEQMPSISGLQRLANEKYLKIHRQTVYRRIARMRKKEFPLAKGLARDPAHHRRRFILPEKFVQEMLREAELKKHLPALLEAGEVVSARKLAKDLGLREKSLLATKGLIKIRIAHRVVVPKAEAERFKNEFRAKRQSGKQKSYVKSPKVNLRKLADKLIRAGRRIEREKTKKLAQHWMKDIIPFVEPGRRALMKRVISASTHFQPEKFRNETEPLLRKLMQ